MRISLTRGPVADVLLIGLLGAAMGALAAYDARLGLAATVAAALGAVALRDERAVAVLAVASLAWTPWIYMGAAFDLYPQLQKILLWAAFGVLALNRGVHRRLLPALLAYPVVALVSALGGTAAEGLTQTQTLETLASLSVAWALIAVRWDFDRDAILLKLVAALPLAALLVGLPLQVAGVWSYFDADVSPPRLQGAMIPSGLGNTAVLSLAAALVLTRLGGWRYGPPLVVLNACAGLLTFTRGSMLAVLVVLLPVLWRGLSEAVSDRRPLTHLRTLFVVTALTVGVLLLAPAIQERNSQEIYVPGRGVTTTDATSGRFDAWEAIYDAAMVNPVFGRGLGAGPALGATQDYFLAQHNEYLRMVLEGGFFGAALLLLALGVTLTRAVSVVPRRVRPDVIALVGATALLALTDNPLTAPTYAATMALIIGISGARSRSRDRSDKRRRELGLRLSGGPRSTRSMTVRRIADA
jgi:O-antigen ligase